MSGDLMNTKEVARYLGVHEKQVYALVKAKRIPSTKFTGKWVFPRKLIDAWIESHARSGIDQARERSRDIEGALLACGSNDPILDMLQSTMKKAHPEFLILSANTGSTEGLKALNRGQTDLAWSHLLDPQSQGPVPVQGGQFGHPQEGDGHLEEGGNSTCRGLVRRHQGIHDGHPQAGRPGRRLLHDRQQHLGGGQEGNAQAGDPFQGGHDAGEHLSHPLSAGRRNPGSEDRRQVH
ncbi:MAG: helix-turn-helix domain-containing protein [Deltaproteobacteria bacterium]|nr:helix-turn-helix domain-containing protein [Deltaproteobacteria bacterium]